MAKLTVKQLEALADINDGQTLREDGGMVGKVKASRTGVSVYFDWRYRFGGKVRQIACGTWPKNSLAAIRAERDQAARLLEDGKDPAEERRAAKLKAAADQAEAIAEQQARLAEIAQQQARQTVRDLFERWASVDLIRHKDGGKEIRRMFEKDVLPLIGNLAVEDVRKGHITGVTDALLSRGVNRMAKMIFSLVRQMFRFGVDRDIIEADPTASIRKAKIGGRDTERDRVLSEDEIRELHRCLPESRLMKTSELAVWLALSTCCRIGELLGARWQHVDIEGGTWLIPAESSKNGKPHTVFLSAFAADHFCQLRTINGTSVWCFPDRTGTQAVCPKTVTKQLGDRQRDAAPMSRRSKHIGTLTLPGGLWTPHDLRRTGATLMVMLGVLPEVAERCLNHTEENRVKRTYQRHSYEPEMREAWRLLGERLELLTGDADNVITFQRKTAA